MRNFAQEETAKGMQLKSAPWNIVGYSTTLYEKINKIGQITISMAITMENPYLFYLVGGFNPSEKYESIGMIISNVWKKRSCSKPPTRYNPIKSHEITMKLPLAPSYG